MNLEIAGKTALVAGGSRGLGRAIAEGLAREGVNVAICGRTASSLERTANEMTADVDADVLPVIADLTHPDDRRSFVQAAVQRWGSVDILVTNSGGPPTGTFDTTDEAAWRAGIENTLLCTVDLIRLAMPHMKARRWGRIVNITSSSVKQPIDGLLLSNSLRAAVVGMAKTLSREVAGDGILVNNICPGSHDTDRIYELAELRAKSNDTTVELELAKMTEAIPLARLGRPSELADAVVFLCSNRASYITGTTLLVDGGAFRGLM